jgi:voltage-gated potassium channel
MNKKLYLSLGFLILTFFIGVIGYKILVGNHITITDCVYMTLITLSTVGFGEVINLDGNPGARVFTMFLIVIGMGNLLYLLSSFATLLLSGKLNDILWRRKIMKTIKKYDKHFIVCGAGNTGLHVINELIRTNREFVIVEQDLELIESLKISFPNVAIIEGDATEDNTLISAGIEKAKGLACVLPTDKDNLFLTITASKLNPKLRIISKVIHIKNRDKMMTAGASSIVGPNFIGALRIVSELIRPKVVTFLDIMLRDKKNLRVEEVEIPEKSKLIGKSLQDLQIRQKVGLQVIAILDRETDEYNYYPEGKSMITQFTTLIVIGEPDKFKKLQTFVSNS